jgi:predicted ATPase with chaperone activity
MTGCRSYGKQGAVMQQGYQTNGNLALADHDESAAQPNRQPGAVPPRMHSSNLPELPPAPNDVLDLGIPERFLEDLVLKMLYRIADPTPTGIAATMHVAPGVVRALLDGLKRQRLVETTASSGNYETQWHYRLSDQGLHEAENAFARSRYVGPVPVPIHEYFAMLRQDQEIGAPDPVALARSLNKLVLGREIVAKVCLALTSGRPAMLWGAPGNGKTTILELCSEAIQGTTLIPLAVFVSGQVIRLFDDVMHDPYDDDWEAPSQHVDRRWIRIRRPFVFVGGELRPEDLDLSYDAATGGHQAPPHLKAHGGLLAIDDFGRQQVSPQALLNRWIAALEREEDTLSLVTGERITFPFRSTICFSTNLDPKAMLEEAHLRRVPYKIRIPDPTPDQLGEIFRRFASALDVDVAERGIETAVEMVKRASDDNLRSCHPRDVLQLVGEEARFVRRSPVLDGPAARRACEIYFAADPGPVADPPVLNYGG